MTSLGEPPGAELRRWATISRCAVITLMTIFASVSHAQVVDSIYPEGQKLNWLPLSGPEPYELSELEMNKLVTAATRAASPSAALYNVDAYYRDSLRSGEVLADLLFGPYDRSDSTFLMDSIVCRRGTFTAWSCEPKDTRTYFRADGLDSLVSFSSGITLETAKLIAAYEDSSCPVSTSRRVERTNRDDVLLAPNIYLDGTAGNYVRDMSKSHYCFINLWLKGGEIDRTKTWYILR